MKDTGMIRSLDSLGRIVIPSEIRGTRNIEIGDSLEFFVTDDGMLVMRKYKSTECAFCRTLDSVVYYKDQFVCGACLQELKHAPAVPVQQAAPIEESASKKRIRVSDMLPRLEQALIDHPESSQSEIAQMLGISQSRVSQLKKQLKYKA